MKRDSIDFGTTSVPVLFRKMFTPTLLGLLSVAALTAIDGIFVGQGVGANGIAGVNIVAPIFLIFTGIGLMLGVGCSVVSSIHLSSGNVKAACLNVTQAFIAATLISLVICVPIMFSPSTMGRLFGASDSLMPWVVDYAVGIVPGLMFGLWCSIGLFVIRLDGSPNFAMWVNVVTAAINIGLDWVFIFPLQMGVFGAGAATSISMAIGGLLAVVYIGRYGRSVRFHRIKRSWKSLRLSLRNIGYQCKIGFSALLGEFTIAVFMFMGNVVFLEYLGDAGVGAFAIACYYLPFIFMFGNAVAQSAQPIISYNITSQPQRALAVQRYALATAFCSGLAVSALFMSCPRLLVELFLPLDNPSARIAVDGLPYFACGFTVFVFNLACIGYYQSVERIAPATVYAMLRGIVFLIPSFLIVPGLLGVPGIWLSMPIAELATLCVIALAYMLSARRNRGAVSSGR